jgi:bifunctional non-homologous end joining protein LigD
MLLRNLAGQNGTVAASEPRTCPGHRRWAYTIPMSHRRLIPPGFVAPCQLSPVQLPPSGTNWLHAIKHDGFRLMVRRGGGRVRQFTRNGHDWAARYPPLPSAFLGAEGWTCRRGGTYDRPQLVP